MHSEVVSLKFEGISEILFSRVADTHLKAFNYKEMLECPKDCCHV